MNMIEQLRDEVLAKLREVLGPDGTAYQDVEALFASFLVLSAPRGVGVDADMVRRASLAYEVAMDSRPRPTASPAEGVQG